MWICGLEGGLVCGGVFLEVVTCGRVGSVSGKMMMRGQYKVWSVITGGSHDE